MYWYMFIFTAVHLVCKLSCRTLLRATSVCVCVAFTNFCESTLHSIIGSIMSFQSSRSLEQDKRIQRGMDRDMRPFCVCSYCSTWISAFAWQPHLLLPGSRLCLQTNCATYPTQVKPLSCHLLICDLG